MAVFWNVSFDAHSVLIRDHIILVVVLAAVLAHDLGLLNIDEHFVGEGNMDEGVEATLVLLQKLSLIQLVREINENKTFLSSRCESEQLDGNLLLSDLIFVTFTDDFSCPLEEWMTKVWVVVRGLRCIVHQLRDRHDRNTKIN